MKKLIFTACFLAAATAFAVFIPLQKDGSIRFKTDARGFITENPMAVAVHPMEKGDRRPAGNGNPDVYIDPPNYNPPPQVYNNNPPPQYQPDPPVYNNNPPPPPPTYDGSYACLKEGFKKAGYKNISQGYINAVAASAKMATDGQRSGGFLGIFGGSVNPQTNFKKSLKIAIFDLAALGVCNKSTYPSNAGGDLLNHTPTEQEYYSAFQIPSGAIVKNHVSPWNPAGIDQINQVFGNYARRRNPQLYNCTRQRESQDTSRDICRALIQTCSAMVCGPGRSCGLGSLSDCNYQEEEHHNGGNNGNGNNGGTVGGNTNNGTNNNGGTVGGTSGNNNGGNNGNTNNGGNNNGGEHETPNGENSQSGYGADGSPGQGNGPPGSN